MAESLSFRYDDQTRMFPNGTVCRVLEITTDDDVGTGRCLRACLAAAEKHGFTGWDGSVQCLPAGWRARIAPGYVMLIQPIEGKFDARVRLLWQRVKRWRR